MGDSVSIIAKKRDLSHKPNALRNEGKIPAVIHNHGKESIHIAVDSKEIKKAYSQAGKHSAIEVDVDGKKYTAMIRELVYKPSTTIAYHTVFQAVSANETVSAQVPLKIVGDIPAEKASLLVVTSLDHLEVEALPKNLVDFIEVNASTLEKAGDRLHVSDIKAPEGVTIKTDPEHVIATVEVPRDQIAEADAALEETAQQEGATAETTEESEDSTEAEEAPKSEEKSE